MDALRPDAPHQDVFAPVESNVAAPPGPPPHALNAWESQVHDPRLLYELLERRLTPWGQVHLLQFWNELKSDQQRTLANEILTVDFGLLAQLSGQRDAARSDWESLALRSQAPPAFRLNAGSASENRFSPQAARRAGEAALHNGEVGVVLVAGGQGTRLGFPHPKGMYPIGPVSGCSLFEILFGKVQATGRRYGRTPPVYIMTSTATHDETESYLQQHGRCGLAADDVRLFCQGSMPAVDMQTGRVLLAEKHRLALSPDGHGGLVAAMQAAGLFADFAARGLKHLFYLQVDNPLVAMCDPEFIGYHLLSESEVSTQVAAKTELREKVGNVVQIDGRLQIIEYSELNKLSDAILRRTMPDGSPVFWAGNTAVHVFDAAFLERQALHALGQPQAGWPSSQGWLSSQGLPFHLAEKRTPWIDANGQVVEPAEPNALKFERFIFDLLPAAAQAIVVEIDPRTHFAPVKNAPGERRDTPESVRAQMMQVHRQWLNSAGVQWPADEPVEIAPSFALDAEELRGRLSDPTPLLARLRNMHSRGSLLLK